MENGADRIKVAQDDRKLFPGPNKDSIVAGLTLAGKNSKDKLKLLKMFFLIPDGDLFRY